MNIEIQVEGEDVERDTHFNLQDWIKREAIDDLDIKRRVMTPEEGKMGIDAGTVLEIVLGSAAVMQLVKSVHTWLKTRRRKIKIRLKANGTELEIDADSPADEQAIVQRAEKLITAAKSK